MSRHAAMPVRQGPAEPSPQRRPGRPVSRTPLLGLQESHGNRAVLRMLHRHEPAGVIRRCGGEEKGGNCACEAEPTNVQRQAAGGQVPPAAVPSSVHETLRAPGQPLDTATRAALEPRFGHDFTAVRVHTGASAAASAKAVAARAYTAGSHIVFGSGAYDPASLDGRHLLAHELAHVVQQRGAPSGTPKEIGRTDDRAEQSADEAARSVLDDGGNPVTGSVPPATAPGRRVLRQAAPAGQVGLAEAERQVGLAEAERQVGLAEAEADPDEVYDGDMPTTGPPAPDLDRGATMMAQGDVPEAAGSAEPLQSPGKAGGPKTPDPDRWITRIDVDLSSQEMTLTWSDGTSDDPRPVSTGKGRPNTTDDPCKTQKEENCTPVGSFKVGFKGGSKHKNRKGDKMSWYVEFVGDRGIGIHDSQLVRKGQALSHGCVRVGDTAADDAFAQKVNQKSRAGKTDIVVTGKAPTKPWTKPVKKPAKRAAPKK